jgi:hypothetical protein
MKYKQVVREFFVHLLYVFLYSAGPMIIFIVAMYKIEEAACPNKMAANAKQCNQAEVVRVE